MTQIFWFPSPVPCIIHVAICIAKHVYYSSKTVAMCVLKYRYYYFYFLITTTTDREEKKMNKQSKNE